MPSGWTRLVLENFEFPYERVFPPDLDKGGLRAKYDVIVFNGAGCAGRRRRTRRGGPRCGAPARAEAPARGGGRGGRRAGRGRRRPRGLHAAADSGGVRAASGQVSAQTMAQVKAFVEEGGTVIAIGGVGDGRRAAVRPARDESPGRERRAAAAREVLRARLRCCASRWTTSNPLAHGLDKQARRLLRQRSRVQADGRCRGQGHAPRRVVRRAASRCAAAGPGGRSISTRASGSSRARVGKGRVFLIAPGDPVPVAAARHLQAVLQRPVSVGRAGVAAGRTGQPVTR